jgi:3-hydroxyisobutyrate dehydrogenase-like beta-hydroxyacid dehydrogenase
MGVSTVGILSPGDMGHSIGQFLHGNGLRVLTCLEGRSERSRELARKAGFEDVASLDDLVQQADTLMCVLVPARATEVAERVAAAMRRTGATPLYVDCNAIAPNTVRGIAETISAAGATVADVGIIGPPPRKPGTRFYASGPGAEQFAALRDHGLDVRIVGDEIGQASGLKMCYGALTKGLQALATELLVAARLMGLEQTLRDEQEASMADVLGWVEAQMPIMPPKAYRWVGEMEEIAATFADLGMTPDILNGAADIYRMVADTPIGKESPEQRDPNRDMYGVIAALADAVGGRNANAETPAIHDPTNSPHIAG